MAPYSIILLGILSTIRFSAYAQEAAVQEPQVFFNLTYTEHLDKVAEASGRSPPDNSDLPWDDTMSSFPWNKTDNGNQTETSSSLSRRSRVFNLGKREPVGGETRNDAVTNDMLQALHGLCVENFGAGWRAASGACSGRSRDVNCGQPGVTGSEARMSRICPEKFDCTTFQAVNFRSRRATFPVCGPRIEVKERHDIGRHTEWEGTWYPEPPKSPGTYDDYIQMAGSLNGYFDFGGAYQSGEGFSSRGSGHSWSCIGCPGGKLTITSTDRATWAVGYTSPH
uniref:Secreted in xylem 1 n=1 Tax=Fusarium oxysporum f. sp. fragariae TaxID=100903 RepID=A0A240FGN3_FUSOX|nr:secreted in xylem 1 [Fusarium oxysporum f. sp. fragariae]WOZ18307.1 secreted in xylem 1 [Fusarium oxysporum f. sp. fragariae]